MAAITVLWSGSITLKITQSLTVRPLYIYIYVCVCVCVCVCQCLYHINIYNCIFLFIHITGSVYVKCVEVWKQFGASHFELASNNYD